MSRTSRARETNCRGHLTARPSLGMFDLTPTGGGSSRRNDRSTTAYSTPGILVEKIYNLANAGIAPTFTNQEFHAAVNSAYGSAVLTINGTVDGGGHGPQRLVLDAAEGQRSYFYPSVSSSLVLSDLFPSLATNSW